MSEAFQCLPSVKVEAMIVNLLVLELQFSTVEGTVDDVAKEPAHPKFVPDKKQLSTT